MRIEGTIKSWNDDRGFGFIEPSDGGEDIFVHIKAINGLRERPQLNQRVSFELELGAQGKRRAVNVELIRLRPAPTSPNRRGKSARWGTASVFAIPVFGIVLALGYMLGHPPRWLAWAYLGGSILTFLAYALDKSAAQKGEWRTSERTLHLMALLGGWPGALLAQQILRHKSSKQEFRTIFWATVTLNILAFMFIASPYAQPVLRPYQ